MHHLLLSFSLIFLFSLIRPSFHSRGMDRLASQSSFLKRHLTGTSDLTLSPPLNITSETFSSVAEFCYSRGVQMTPANVAAIRTAAELLGMAAAGGEGGGESLSHVAEAYFRRVVGVNREYASMVLRSCLPLLPDAETTASLVSRCIEAMVSADDNNHLYVSSLNDVVGMHPEDFLTVAESMSKRFGNHDVLYKMVDFYLKENGPGKLAEDQKIRICNCIECTKLSTGTLADCVQNPRMPLRFVVRAVLAEHLNTRHSISSASSITTGSQKQQRHQLQFQSMTERERHRRFTEPNSLTLGDLLRRDAALRQTAHLKAAMDATNARIQSLEKELSGLNKVLLERQAEEKQQQRNVPSLLGPERSASFHFVPTENGRIERGEKWSVSSASLRFDAIMENHEVVGRSSFSGGGGGGGNGNPKMTKSFRQRLMTGLKSAFRVPSSA